MHWILLTLVLFLAGFTHADAEENQFVGIKSLTKCHAATQTLPASELEKLSQLGITEKDWQGEGVECFAGDFNGDKVTDYVLTPFFDAQINGAHAHWRAAVIFMPASVGVPTVTVIQKDLYNLPVLYPRDHSEEERNRLSSYGCPVDHEADGIIEWGEGASSYIFLWDRKKSDFVTHRCLSETS